MKIELLLGKSVENCWEICGITYFGAASFGSDFVALRATKIAIEKAKMALEMGLRVCVSKDHEFAEILPSDLVIEEVDALTTKKRIALNDVNSAMHQNILSLCVVDALDYLKSYMDLLAGGVFISNANREDKYFEVIEAAQANPEPEMISDDASIEEEQEYLNKKKLHRVAQDNLETLEKYLNSLDKIQKVDGVNKILQDAKEQIEQAQTAEEVDAAMKTYYEVIDKHFYLPFGANSLVPRKMKESPSSVSTEPQDACKEAESDIQAQKS